MAQRTVVTVTCDLEHDKESEVEGVKTIPYAVDGISYEIDVCQVHSEEMAAAFGRYAEAGRRVAERQRAEPAASRQPKRIHSSNPGAVRAWATEKRAAAIVDGDEEAARHYTTSAYGRVPSALREEYERTH